MNQILLCRLQQKTDRKIDQTAKFYYTILYYVKKISGVEVELGTYKNISFQNLNPHLFITFWNWFKQWNLPIILALAQINAYEKKGSTLFYTLSDFVYTSKFSD